MKNRIHVIITDLYDEQVFNEIMEQFSSFQEQNPLLRAFHKDLFHALFQAFPKMASKDEMDRAYLYNHHQLSMLMETMEFKKMKAETTHDELAAGMTAVVFLNRIKEKWNSDPELKKVLDKAKDMQLLEEMMNQLLHEEKVYNDLAELAAKKGKPQKTELEQMAQEAKKKANEIGGQIAALEKELLNMQAAIQSKIRQSYRDIAEAVTDEVAEMQAAVASWGSGSGGMGEVSSKDRIELAKRLQANPKLRELADMMGRMKHLASSKLEERITKEPSMIVGVTTGNDIEEVLPEELSLLSSAAKPLFYKKYVEKSLLQYQTEGKKKTGRGAIVALLDNSESMTGYPEMMLKAIILGGVLTVATREKRDVYLVFFSDDVVAEFSFPNDMDDQDRIRTMLEVAEVGPAGGTDYVPPLKKGLEKLSEKEYQKADILFITDGLCTVPDDFLKWFRSRKEQKGFRVTSVLLDNEETEVLQGFSDKVFAFKVVGEGVAHAILDELI